MQNIKNIFTEFNNKKIIIVGDVMIDTYINGKVTRISPEAPVPVVNFGSIENRLGGAANVALNIKALGAEPIICSCIGKDKESNVFLELLKENKMVADGIIQSNDRVTTIKTRIIGNNQQLLRIDQEKTNAITTELENQLFNEIKKIAISEKVDAIIFQDYNKGVLTEKLIEKTIEFANQNKIITTVDPKKDNFLAYKNVTLFKPNLKELKEGVNFNFDGFKKENFLEAVEQLNQKIKSKYTFVTLSENGVFIQKDKHQTFIPAHLRNITDVSGAGDTVISVATLCLVCDLEAKEIAEISNLAGGLVCEKVGVISIDKEQLLNELLSLYN